MVNCVHITELCAILYVLFKMSAVSLNLSVSSITYLIKYTGFIVNINKWKSNIFVLSAKLSLITNARNQQLLQFIFIVSLVYIYIYRTNYNCE